MSNIPDDRDAISFLASKFTMKFVGCPSLSWHNWFSNEIKVAIKERGIKLENGELIKVDDLGVSK